MIIQQIRTIQGPNVYSHRPVLAMRLDLEDLTEKESCDIPGFIDRLLHALPGVHDHHCGKGRPDGFVERLYEGTYFGHIVEHVCLELTDRAGISVNRGKTVQANAPNVYEVAVEYKSERGMRRLLEIAVDYVQALIDDRPYPLDERIQEVIRIVDRYELGPSTKAIVDAAEARGIPWVRLNEDSLVQLGQGRQRKFIQAAMSSGTGSIPVEIAGDKSLTKSLLARAAVPTPSGRVVASAEAAVKALDELGVPLAVKPLDGNQGKGVSVHVSTADQVREAFAIAHQFSDEVIVEQAFSGRDYRVLVVNGSMLAATERVPAHVTGDGLHTIEELIAATNRDSRRGNGHNKPMTCIRIDAVLLNTLRKQGLELSDVLPEGKTVILRENANLSTGGSAIDVTDAVHPTIRHLCERAARAIGLDICGVDLVIPDIAEPFSSGGVVEVNAAPGLRMHHFPAEGKARDVASGIVETLYPTGNGRIPIVSVTGTNGKTTVTRLIAHILAESNSTIGMTTTDGIWVGRRQIASGDTTGPRSAATILFDPDVDVAVLETARGGIVRNGLGYDWSDVGVMTNIQADHIGQDGIEHIDDILRIKALVAERVREGGALVLNADDPMLVQVPLRSKVSRVPKRIIWFAFDAANPVLHDARQNGGTVYFVADGSVYEANGQSSRRIIETSRVPITFGGAARFQIANVMAAVAAARAMGTGVAQIRAALRSFEAGEHNPARANLFAVNGGYALFDYGHNTAAIEAIAEMATRWPAEKRIAILGVPGDRADDIIRDAGRAAARSFDRIVLRDERDLRGRQPGEIPRLLAEAIRGERGDVSIEVVAGEMEAISRAVDDIRPGHLIVSFCDDCSGVRSLLLDRGAVAVSSFAHPEAAAGAASAEPEQVSVA
jgi:cyanophycin synthetase